MMKEVTLLKFLKSKKNPTSACVLAEYMHVSTRTIRNYVKKINETVADKVVIANKQGYKLQLEFYEKSLFVYEEIALNCAKKRSKYLSRLLLKNNFTISTEYLLDELTVSETTLQNDLRQLTSYYTKYNLILKKENGYLKLEGLERNKRMLIREIIAEETQDQILAFYNSQDVLKDDEVAELRSIIETEIAAHSMHMNEFALSNVILHLVIAIMRLKQERYIESDKYFNKHSGTIEYNLATAIFETVICKHNIQVTSEEIESLSIMLTGNMIMNNKSELIDHEIIQLTHYIIEQVNQTYRLELQSDSFIRRFSIHVNNLIKRRKNGFVNDNPLLDVLKKRNLMLYDIGLYIASLIKKKITILISDDEVAYLALHIGILLEEEASNNAVTLAIVSLAYNQMEKRLVENISHYFKEQIVIKNVVTTYQASLSELDVDIVISAIDYEPNEKQEYIRINPIFNLGEMKNIERSIAKVRRLKEFSIYQQMVHDYFDEPFFYYQVIKKSKEDYIKFIGNKIVKAGIINEKYCVSILEREEMSSTVFNTIAVPHSLYRTANRSLIGILYNKESILWDENKVELVLFVVISGADNPRFSAFLQLLIEVLAEPQAVKQVSAQTNYNDFIREIISLIQKKIESE